MLICLFPEIEIGCYVPEFKVDLARLAAHYCHYLASVKL